MLGIALAFFIGVACGLIVASFMQTVRDARISEEEMIKELRKGENK